MICGGKNYMCGICGQSCVDKINNEILENTPVRLPDCPKDEMYNGSIKEIIGEVKDVEEIIREADKDGLPGLKYDYYRAIDIIGDDLVYDPTDRTFSELWLDLFVSEIK